MSSHTDQRGGWSLAAPILIMSLIVFVVPFLSVIRTSVAPGRGLASDGWSWEHYQRVFSDSVYLRALVNTLWLAAVAVVITAGLGLVYAYLLATRPRFQKLQLALLLAPLLINGVVRIFGLQLGVEALNRLLVDSGLLERPLNIIYSPAGVILAFVMFQFPFMAAAIFASLARLDTSLLEAARTLGAGRVQTFLRLVLPMAMPGVAAGSVLSFAGAAGSYIVPAMMGGGRVVTMPQMIFSSVGQMNEWGAASALAVVLITVLLIPVLVIARRASVSTAGGR